MKSNFLRIRILPSVYESLKIRAAEAGKPVSTFAHALLEQENSIANTAIQLAEIKSHLQELSVLLVMISDQPSANHELNSVLLEVLLIVRELAIERNAQILGRVAAKIKLNTERS